MELQRKSPRVDRAECDDDRLTEMNGFDGRQAVYAYGARLFAADGAPGHDATSRADRVSSPAG